MSGQGVCLLILTLLSFPLLSEERVSGTTNQPSSATSSPRLPDPPPGTPPRTSSTQYVSDQNRETSVNDEQTTLRSPPSDTTPTRITPQEDPRANATPKPATLVKEGSLLNNSLPVNYKVASTQPARKPLHQLVITAKDLLGAERQRKSLKQYGFSISSRKNLNNLGIFLSTFQIPKSLSLEKAQNLALAAFPDSRIEANTRYDLLGMDIKRYGQKMMNISRPSTCQQAVHIAMLDSLVNPNVIKAKPGHIQIINVTDEETSDDKHGTAIANLLLSHDEHSPGVLPNSYLYAINVFSQEEASPIETRLNWLLYGFNILAGLKPTPDVANLSFGGAYSAILEDVILKVSESVTLVAAAGNAGNNELIYPAAYDKVIAVGSMNAKGQRAKDSNYGSHVKLFAPGEDIWTIDQHGTGFFARGTSYAAPFASAAIAIAKSNIHHYLKSLHPSNMISFASLCH